MSEMTVNSKSITHLNAFFLVFTIALKEFYWKVLLSYIKHASMYLEKYSQHLSAIANTNH